jgi:hypothetical protein
MHTDAYIPTYYKLQRCTELCYCCCCCSRLAAANAPTGSVPRAARPFESRSFVHLTHQGVASALAQKQQDGTDYNLCQRQVARNCAARNFFRNCVLAEAAHQ